MVEVTQLDIKGILDLIPHRYPLIMVDKIVEAEPGKWARGIKNVSMNEPYFQGHFPGHPVMPGVLILEGLAQVGAIMSFLELTNSNPMAKLVYFAGMDKVRFRRMVSPGDQLVLETKKTRERMKIWSMESKAFVDGQLVAEANLMATYGEE